jgi:hypothetical protein
LAQAWARSITAAPAPKITAALTAIAVFSIPIPQAPDALSGRDYATGALPADAGRVTDGHGM